MTPVLNPRLLRASLRSLLRRPWQTGLMVLGIALGVAVVVAIDLANSSASRSFALSTETMVGRATHTLAGGPAGLPEELYRWLRVERGLRLSAPVVEGLGVAVDLDEQPLRVLGLDPLAEAPLRDILRGPALELPGLARLLTDPQAVLVGAGLAQREGLSPGDRLNLQVNDRLARLTVVGLLEPAGSQSAAALDGLAVMDIAAAQELLGLAGRLTRLDLLLDPAQAAALQAALPAGVRLLPASEQAETAAQLTAAFELNLTALSLMALVVGMFLIYNTVMFSVVQRRAVLATLRALGLTGPQLLTMILLEGAVVAGAGAALGVGLGLALGRGAVALVGQTINDLYYVQTVAPAPLSASSVVKGLGLGLAAGLVGALLPALEAASVPPVTALQRSSLEQRARRWLPWTAAAGAGLAAAGGLAMALSEDSLPASLAALSAIVIGMALLVPAAVVALMRLAEHLLGRVGGALGRAAPRAVARSLSRTGIALAALTISVSVTIAVSTMIASFRGTVTEWLDLVLRADLYIAAPGPGGATSAVRLPPEWAARLETVPGVERVEPYRTIEVESAFGPVELTAVDARRGRAASLYRFAAGDAERVWARVLEGAVVISEPLAYRSGLRPRQTLELQTDRGRRRFDVAAVYYDYSADRGALIMTLETFHAFWDDRSLTSLGVFVEPAADEQAVAAGLRAALRGTGLLVTPNRLLRQQALEVFDRTFAITGALRVLTLAVAVIGIVSALTALQLERGRELATLQALGAAPAQVQRLTLLETGLMGACAGLLAWPVGLLLAVLLVRVINLRSFGWTIELAVEPSALLQALLFSLAAALAAALYPLARLRRAEVAAALRQE